MVVRFQFRNPAIGVAFGCWHSHLDFVSIVALPPDLKGVKFEQFGHFTGELFDHRTPIWLLHLARYINEF